RERRAGKGSAHRTSRGRERRAGVAWAAAFCVVAAVAGLAWPAWSQAPEELVVVNYGGTFAKYWNEYIIEPFSKQFNAKVTQVTSLTMDTVAKLRAQKDNPQIDVVMMADAGSVIAANEGLLEPLDESKIPNMKELIPQARPQGRSLRPVPLHRHRAGLEHAEDQDAPDFLGGPLEARVQGTGSAGRHQRLLRDPVHRDHRQAGRRRAGQRRSRLQEDRD